MNKLHRLILSLGLLLLLIPCACTEKESDLGVNLQDPYTLYSGTRDTAYMSAVTLLDDSLLASNYAAGVLGDYLDPVFGYTKAIIYSEIGITSTTGISLTDDVIIDSVVMTLVIDTLYPILPEGTPCPMHFIVKQLAEAIVPDSNYLSRDSIATSNNILFDGTVTFVADSVRLRMNENIYSVLKQNCPSEEFRNNTKGLSLELADHSQMMATIDFAATNTALTMYYHTAEVDSMTYSFVINSGASHSLYFRHDYSSSVMREVANGSLPSLAGNEHVYLQPLGGTKVLLDMQPFIDNFRTKHPSAVIHYAELLLPISDTTLTQNPVRIMALKHTASGNVVYVTDLDYNANPYTYTGYDGYYDRSRHCYRLRVSRHLQELLRSGKDYGTELVIDARRSSAFSVVLNGTEGERPIAVDFVYSE